MLGEGRGGGGSLGWVEPGAVDLSRWLQAILFHA